ncbi:hypothetical protein ASPWEDRAFT_103504 [Aspergillus wentii DTO 134E9]|uniref:DUF2423 domain-containing protein n=1 Tax=Aspergillus wentii DTO 134E9 TaxID=1073089 RepID=A0A1L9RUE9_ASPWE|nr:uncharacterized protein ASPWEDRAFT_103504 [Aspergillus wentii DTO 134E9]OJJ38549.1 hypothetical protein ASPWEDRAFT_103504 [Aspergillus wentii DTO 134E9]
MAKSVRASVSKRNKAKLRATVFGPAVDARTERLSAKLQELASQPKPQGQKKGVELDAAGADGLNENIKMKDSDLNEDMDVDRISAKPTTSRTNQPGRIQKRNKKSRSSIVFKQHPSKSKKGSKRK